jgi:deoxyribonuclease-4
MSVAGGLHLAFDLATQAGCDCLQIFVKNQRQWTAKPLTDEQVADFHKSMAATRITPVVAHASYLINMASPDDALRQKSIAAMTDELTRCEALGVASLVVHPGAHMGEGVDAGIARIARSLDAIHAATGGFKTTIALEVTAGQGSTVGFEIAHLGRIIAASKEPGRLRICLDTCHLFAAGYDLSDSVDYQRMADELAAHVRFENVSCIHCNDSKGDRGSRIDRHDHITQGRIGRRGFENIPERFSPRRRPR